MNIMIMTAAFPYHPGEQFLEDEIPYWGETSIAANVTLIPLTAMGGARKTPKNIRIDTSLAKKTSKKWIRLFYCAQTLFYPFFYKEIVFLAKEGKLSLKNLGEVILCSSMTLLTFKHLKAHLEKKEEGPYCIYSYWNEASSYGAALARKDGLVDIVVSRAHGYDVYEERRANNYMPLKRQFAKQLDSIFVLSKSAQEYMHKTYTIPKHILQIAPLGVPLPEKTASPSESGKLNIASVSFCVPVKRIDKIIEAIARFAEFNTKIAINWDHIGDGPLFDELNQMAYTRLKTQKNVTFRFHGAMSNTAVKSYFSAKNVDIFINASESEGIPVSIMEAMAAGVLPIAPNVGGIANLVSNDFGVLLHNNPSIEDLTAAIIDLSLKSKNLYLRTLARERIEEHFNAEKNYSHFIKTVLLMNNKKPIMQFNNIRSSL